MHRKHNEIYLFMHRAHSSNDLPLMYSRVHKYMTYCPPYKKKPEALKYVYTFTFKGNQRFTKKKKNSLRPP